MMTLGILGGIAVFIFGLRLLKNNLEQIAGERIRNIIHHLTSNVLRGILMGIIITLIFQSSTATTVLLVGFANSELITLMQSMGVILGGDIGTTLTVQLISFNIYDYSLIAIILGVIVIFTQKTKKSAFWGNSLIGIGLVFLGMKIMTDVTALLKEMDFFNSFIKYLENHPFGLMIFATVFTAIVQSSAATIGLIISLASSGAIHSIDIAIPVILGANVGTCSTALLASLSASTEGRRIALAHLLFKIAGAAIFYPLREHLSTIAVLTATTLPHQVANAHTLFNILITIIFVPFVKPGAFLISRTVRESIISEEKFSSKFLNPSALETPSLALANSSREILRMADIVGEMLKKSIDVFKPENADEIEKIREMDDKVDILDQQLKIYITKISQSSLSEELANLELELLSVTINLENIGDVIDKNLMMLAEKKLKYRLFFSTEGYEELKKYHSLVCENYELAISAFTGRSFEIAHKVIGNQKMLGDLIQTYTENHFQRLRKGLKESIETSSIHLDILSNLHRINSYITNCAYPIINRGSKPKN